MKNLKKLGAYTIMCAMLLLAFGIAGCSSSDQFTTIPPSDSVEAAKDAGGIDNPSGSTRMIGSGRTAVVNECWYALRKSSTSPSTNGPSGGKSIGGNMVSDWNYMASDTSAASWIIKVNTANITQCTNYPTASFLTSNAYGLKNGYGRGMQCLTFARYILYRSLHYTNGPTSWSTYTSNISATKAQPGDIVYYKTGTNTGHVAICVKNMGTSGIDVVDSNFVGYNQGYSITGSARDSEIIGRHPVSIATINSQGWKTYSGQGRWY